MNLEVIDFGWRPLLAILVVGLMVGVAAAEGLKQAVYIVDELVDRWTLYRINSLYAVSGLTLAGVVYAWLPAHRPLPPTGAGRRSHRGVRVIG